MSMRGHLPAGLIYALFANGKTYTALMIHLLRTVICAGEDPTHKGKMAAFSVVGRPAKEMNRDFRYLKLKPNPICLFDLLWSIRNSSRYQSQGLETNEIKRMNKELLVSSVRKLSSGSWAEFVTVVNPPISYPMQQWKVSLRFASTPT